MTGEPDRSAPAGDLQGLREALEQIDHRLLRLLRERMNLVEGVAEAKLGSAWPFRDPAREDRLLLRLRDKGNTVLVVEHKPEAIAIADHVVDLGPGAGDAGGPNPPAG